MLQIHDYYSGERGGISLSGKILINPKKKLEGSLFLNLLYHLSRRVKTMQMHGFYISGTDMYPVGSF